MTIAAGKAKFQSRAFFLGKSPGLRGSLPRPLKNQRYCRVKPLESGPGGRFGRFFGSPTCLLRIIIAILQRFLKFFLAFSCKISAGSKRPQFPGFPERLDRRTNGDFVIKRQLLRTICQTLSLLLRFFRAMGQRKEIQPRILQRK